MLHAVQPRRLTQLQIDLLEHALRRITEISPSGWDSIPVDLHPYFMKYMDRDAWTGQSDLLTLREAALLIVRDAITQSGEFERYEPPEY
ncbi:MAG TPA: hypothetical protein VH639_10200 [Bryobacteraceae bacterium]|jgi:hypothetical protein